MLKSVFRISSFILVAAFSQQAYSLSCARPAVEYCKQKKEGVERDLCLLSAKVDKGNDLLSSKVSAESCALANKMNRREFSQSQCKTSVRMETGLCNHQYYACLPNGSEGNVYHLGRRKIYKSEADLNPGNVFIHEWDSRKVICKDGRWVNLSAHKE